MGVDTVMEQLRTIPDWRRGRKGQYPLWLMLLVSLLGGMSGYSSLRGVEAFMQRQDSEVAARFGLAQAKLPSYSTWREMVEPVDGAAVAQIFQHWAQATLAVPVGAALAIEGKALGSTVKDPHGKHQGLSVW